MRGFARGAAAAIVWLGLVAPAAAQTAPEPAPAMTEAQMRELIEAAKSTAKATRDTADYVRVQPDILHQILVKLDKLEDKLDKVENAIKAQQQRRR